MSKWDFLETSLVSPMNLGKLSPEGGVILHKFHRPLIYTSTIPGNIQVLVYLSCIVDGNMRFIVTPTTQNTIESLILGKTRVKDALEQNWTWVVDKATYEGDILNCWSVDFKSIDPTVLPSSYFVLDERMAPDFVFKVDGPYLVEGSTPASAIDFAINAPKKAFRLLGKAAERFYGINDRDDSLGDFEVLSAKAASYEIAFRFRRGDPFLGELDINTDEDDETVMLEDDPSEDFLDTVLDLLEIGFDYVNHIVVHEGENVGNPVESAWQDLDDKTRMYLLDAIMELCPNQKGGYVETSRLFGDVMPKNITLYRETKKVASRVYNECKVRFEKRTHFHGIVSAVASGDETKLGEVKMKNESEEVSFVFVADFHELFCELLKSSSYVTVKLGGEPLYNSKLEVIRVEGRHGVFLSIR
jgi:hypothetical protein